MRRAGQGVTRLPSARVLDELRARSEAFFEFAMRKSEEHRATLLAATLPAGRREALEAEASASLTRLPPAASGRRFSSRYVRI